MFRRLVPTPWLRDFVFCATVSIAGLAVCAVAAAGAG
jgi:hypothetical protein